MEAREVSAKVAAYVLAQYDENGALPQPLIRHIQANALMTRGRLPTSDEVRRYVREWADRWGSAIDKGAPPSTAGET